MNTPGYEQLAAVLQAAYDQAAKGKGAERHADNKPFHEQPMQTGSDLLGTDAGLAFQAIKKVREGSTFAEFDRFEREMLGAINYIAGMVIWRRRQIPNDPDLCPECGYPTDEAGTHYATCSRLTAPKEFVEQVEQAFDALETLASPVDPTPVCGGCGREEGRKHRRGCPTLTSEDPFAELVVTEEPRLPEPLRSNFIDALESLGQADYPTDPFAGAPEWAMFKAQDKDRGWWWYSHRPVAGDVQWQEIPKEALEGGEISTFAYAHEGPAAYNWRDTLIERTSGQDPQE